ncbi:hypothetical protein L1987_11556 [Smallanthus sonchifolius]|uniref:Uncharacterized protein n=1 Tax=Smallanthus sonchifolius TaxID=185202 RepID=A0ACB9JDK1_9ASTR|nr:hypothetical protein L1987_11556 [Smallanthus sonchifolius]
MPLCKLNLHSSKLIGLYESSLCYNSLLFKSVLPRVVGSNFKPVKLGIGFVFSNVITMYGIKFGVVLPICICKGECIESFFSIR